MARAGQLPIEGAREASVDAPREILVRAPNWVGDIVMATPGLRALRAGYPAARITVQARAEHLELLAGAPFVDRIRAVESYHRGPLAMLSEAARLRVSVRYDLGICIPDSFSSALLMRLAGVERVCGYRRGGRAALLHRAIDPPADWPELAAGRRMVARERFVLDLMAALGCAPRGDALELTVTPSEARALEALRGDRASLDFDRPWVALAPGAAYGPAKLWPAEHFAAVGDALARAGAQVLVIGAASERPVAAAVVRAMREAPVDLVGRIGLGALKALVSRLRLLVCNDAGARHVAAAFEVPSIVFFGPTSVAKTDCNLDAVEVFERAVSCRPCYRRSCPIDHACLRGIEPGPVIERATKILAQAPPR